MQRDSGYAEGGTADQLTVPQSYDYAHGASPTPSHGTTVVWSGLDGPSSPGDTLPGHAGVQDSFVDQWPPVLEHPAFDSHHVRDELEIALQNVDRERKLLTTLHETGASFLRRSTRIAALREDALSLHARLVFEWENCINHRKFVTESQDNFIKEATAFLASIPPELSSERLVALHNQTLQDYERQNELAQKTRDMGLSLSDLEYSLHGKERRLALSTNKIVDILKLLNLPGQSGSATAVETEPSSPPSEAESVELPALIQHYFDKAGDVNDQKDYLLELELEHREALETRIILADQERPLSRSNEEFEKMFLEAYAKGELALADATKKADMAKEICLMEDMDPEDYRKAPSRQENERTATPAPSDTADLQQTPSLQAVGVYDDVQTYKRISALNLSEEAQGSQTQNSALASPTNRRRKRTKARPNQRIQDWIAEIYDEADGTSRSRSQSESRDAIPIFEKRDDGTLAFNRKSPQAQDTRYQKRGSLASYLTAFASKPQDQRPKPLKKSSSETELTILPARKTPREEMMQALRTYAMGSGRA